MWKPQCGHHLHAECLGRNARVHAPRGSAGADVEAPCEISRGPGVTVAEYPYAGHIDASS
eukprot:6989496-Pyramimonas_sp.AAC.1